MAFKINIGEKSGKTYKLEASAQGLIDKEVGDKIDGKEIKSDFDGYEFEITGGSDQAGFPLFKEVPGQILKGVLLKYGKGMHKKPRREGKKPAADKKPRGLRLRKTVRGRVISDAVVQINLKVLKAGKKPLVEIFAPAAEPAVETPAQ
ncbi:30S ribosomal protein S6e [archaeon]|nr:30S ribosomal protein S6e [archaeon]